ncbi:MAG: ThiF family adenylyltransferase [Pirellulaceae bacterium]
MTDESLDRFDLGELSRYSRQIRFSPIGIAGQEKLRKGRVLLIGVGALGSVTAEILARAGVGFLKLVDRDFVDVSNLQRQSLFVERDAQAGIPKVVAAAKAIHEINSTVSVESVIADVTPQNIAELASGVDLILDGTDNFEIRFLINDLSVREQIPWIYTGCLGADGQSLNILPGKGPCLRCLMPEGPPTITDTCDTAGVVGSIVHVMSAIQALEAIKFLSGNESQMTMGMQVVSMWDARSRVVPLDRLFENSDCATCRQRRFEWLEEGRFTQVVRLCGRNSVQINPAGKQPLELVALEARLRTVATEVVSNAFLVRFKADGKRVTVFADGRAIIEGTDDFVIAKSIYTRYLG